MITIKNQGTITAVSATLLTILICLGWLGVGSVQNQLKEKLREQLKSNLSATLDAFKYWANDKKINAEILSSQPLINQNMRHLIRMSKANNNSKELLLGSEQLAWLRTHLGASCTRFGFIGFVIFDLDGNQVGALLDSPVGESPLKEKGGFFFKSVRGEIALSLPFQGEVPLPDINGKMHSSWPTMFVSAPIVSPEGQIEGVLALRIRPEIDLSKVMTIARFAKTGESYMFDKEATLLTQSRFDQQLGNIHLLDPGQLSILNIKIRAPGRNLINQPLSKNEKNSKWPLTKMALSALQQTTDENVEGYSDYRGVPVVGAWTWVPEYQFGITTEIDKDEAYGPIQTLVKWFLGLATLLIIACIVGWKFSLVYGQNRKESLQNERRLNSLINSLQDSIIAIDKKGTILSASPSVKERFQYSPQELIGKNVRMLMPEPYKSEHDSYLKNYLRTGQAKIINLMRILEGQRKDGTVFPMELRVTEILWDGKPQFTGIIRDITDLKQSEEKLIEANQLLEDRIDERTKDLNKATQKAERGSEAKSEFLSRMSHELRTPMNAILGFSQLMRANTVEELTKNQHSQVDEIMKAGKHLLELINEVLDLSSIESGKITLSPEPVDIVDLITEVITILEPMADQYKIKLVNETEKNEALFVKADKVRVKQVLLNLISNGIKYNRIEGSVTLSTKNSDGNFLRINVQDTGMGISSEKLQKIFEPFDRLGAETSETEGSGIGMTITKKLMEVMDGSINVESVVGEGSCFYIMLPKCEAPRKRPHLKGENTKIPILALLEQDKGHTHSLLYIEDNSANLRLVEDILKSRPYIHFLSASQSELGLNLARSHCPDLIILDINLPGLDGYQTLKHLENYHETFEIPVIALSANAMPKDIKKGLDAGFKEYLTKPLEMEHFLKVIDKFIPLVKPQ